jgi:hypothetical protein
MKLAEDYIERRTVRGAYADDVLYGIAGTDLLAILYHL